MSDKLKTITTSTDNEGNVTKTFNQGTTEYTQAEVKSELEQQYTKQAAESSVEGE